jgi:4-oxalocrotonate tautomerase
MPIVTVETLSGRTVEQKRELVKAITQALVDIYQVPAERVHVVLHEVPAENIGRAGALLSDIR